MRKTFFTAVLLLAFSCSALAGEMPTPPAPQPLVTAQEPTGGEIGIPGVSDSLTQTVLDLLAALPSLF